VHINCLALAPAHSRQQLLNTLQAITTGRHGTCLSLPCRLAAVRRDTAPLWKNYMRHQNGWLVVDVPVPDYWLVGVEVGQQLFVQRRGTTPADQLLHDPGVSNLPEDAAAMLGVLGGASGEDDALALAINLLAFPLWNDVSRDFPAHGQSPPVVDHRGRLLPPCGTTCVVSRATFASTPTRSHPCTD
jgi:hypothetical protein